MRYLEGMYQLAQRELEILQQTINHLVVWLTAYLNDHVNGSVLDGIIELANIIFCFNLKQIKQYRTLSKR